MKVLTMISLVALLAGCAAHERREERREDRREDRRSELQSTYQTAQALSPVLRVSHA